jgi:hypothetical protein
MGASLYSTMHKVQGTCTSVYSERRASTAAMSSVKWLRPLPFLDAASFPQQEILHDEFAVAARQWPAASAARYFAISRLRASFDFDDVVESLAIRAFEKRLAGCRNAGRFANDSHGTPPVP